MRVYIQSVKRCVSVPIPLSIARITAKVAIVRSVKQSKKKSKRQVNADENNLKDKLPSKGEIDNFLSAAVKLLKDYKRTNGKFVLAEICSDDGESIIITV